jgi:hypothetical protein
MAQYKWRVGGPKFKIAADTFGKAVEDIIETSIDEVAKAKRIVDVARPNKSTIHRAFQWDNEKAGELYRVDQARKYLGALEIVRVQTREGPTVSNRAFFAVRSLHGYVQHGRVLNNNDLRIEVIASARRELETFIAKYASILNTFGNLIPKLQDIMDSMRAEVERLEAVATTPPKPPTPPKSPRRSDKAKRAGADARV